MTISEIVIPSVANGVFLSLALGTVVIGGLAITPETGLQGYPPAVRAAYGPPRRETRIARAFIGLLFLVFLTSGLAVAVFRTGRYNGSNLTFGQAWLSAYTAFTVFNLFDLLLIDGLLFILIRPRFVVLPGTEDMDEYGDFVFHLRESGKGLVIGAVVAALVAAVLAPMMAVFT